MERVRSRFAGLRQSAAGRVTILSAEAIRQERELSNRVRIRKVRWRL